MLVVQILFQLDVGIGLVGGCRFVLVGGGGMLLAIRELHGQMVDLDDRNEGVLGRLFLLDGFGSESSMSMLMSMPIFNIIYDILERKK